MKKYWPIFLLILLAFALYFPNLSSLPTSFHGDEGETAMQALELLQSRKIIGVGWYDIPYTAFWPYALTIVAFGQNIVAPRLAAAFFALLTIPLFYLLAKNMFSEKVAIISSLTFATSHLFLAMARIGTFFSQATFVTVASLYFLIAAFQKKSKIYFVLAGIFLAFSLYSYYPARITPLLCSVVVLYYLIKEKTKIIILLIILVTSFLITVTPMINFFYHFPETFFSRTNSVYIFSKENQAELQNELPGKSMIQILLTRFTEAIDVSKGDKSGQYGYRGQLLDFVSIAFLLLGLVTALFQRNFFFFFVVFWVVSVFFFGQVLTTSPSPIFLPRFTVGLPALYLLIALGIEQISKIPKLPPDWKNVLIISVVSIIIFLNLQTYFYLYPRQIAGDINARAATQIAVYLNTLPNPYKVIFLTAPNLYADFGTLRFLTPDKERVHIPQPQNYDPSKDPTLQNNRQLVFVLYPQYQYKLVILSQFFPNGEFVEKIDINQQPLFYIYKTD